MTTDIKYVGCDDSSLELFESQYVTPEGEPCVNFGKHKGKTARKVFETEPGYFSWIQQGSFSLDTKACFARLEEQFKRERLAAKWSGR